MKLRLGAVLLLGVLSAAGCSSADQPKTAPPQSTTTTKPKPKLEDLARQAAQHVGRLHALIPVVGPNSSAMFAGLRTPLEQERIELRRLIDTLAGLKSAAAGALRHVLSTDQQIVGELLASSGDASAIAKARGQLDATDTQWHAAVTAVAKETGAHDLGI